MSHLQPAQPALDPGKFRDPRVTAKGEARAAVALSGLRTLWINTGTLCNITCRNCYIESSPRNDALVYITACEVAGYLDEIARDRLPVEEVGFTGGEPFLNRELPAMLRDAMRRGHRALVLTNAMKPMRNHAAALLDEGDKRHPQASIKSSHGICTRKDGGRRNERDAVRAAGTCPTDQGGLPHVVPQYGIRPVGDPRVAAIIDSEICQAQSQNQVPGARHATGP